MEPRKAIERAIVCAAFQGVDEVDRIASQITDMDISQPDLRAVWLALRHLAETRAALDPVLVLEHLSKRNAVPASIGLALLTELRSATWEAAHVDHYCSVLQQHATTDDAHVLGEQLASEPVIDQPVIDGYIQKLDQIQRGRKDEIRTAEDAIRGLEHRRANPRAIHATGISEIDRMLKGGLKDGQIMVVGGRPGAGKSVLLTQIAVGIASRGEAVLIVSLEMLKEEIADRLSRGHSPEWIAALPMFFLDTTSDLGTICSLTRVAARRHKIRCVVVDYLQLAEVPQSRSDNRERQIATISRRLKRLAMDLQVPIVVGSQLNRESQKRGKPTLSDLRESGSIEQDADVVVLLSKDDESNDTLLEIAKHRGGATGEITMQLNGPMFRFEATDRFADLSREFK